MDRKQAEDSFLGLLCADLSLLKTMQDMSADDFTQSEAKELFKTCQKGFEKGYKKITPSMVDEKIKAKVVQAEGDIKFYADKIKEDKAKEGLYKMIIGLSSTMAGMSANELKSHMEKQLEKVKTRSYDFKIDTFENALKEDYQFDNDDRVIPVYINEWDEKIGGGFYVNLTHAIMAPSGVGKSTAMLNAGIRQAEKGHRVLIISMEMDRIRILKRAMAIVMDRHIGSFNKKNIESEMKFAEIKNDADDMFNEYLGGRLHITCKQFKLSEILALIDSVKGQYDIIYCDYIGLVQYDGKQVDGEVIQQKIVSESVRLAIKDTDMAWVWLSQVSLKQGGNPNDINSYRNKGSSQLENDCGTMVLIFKNKPMTPKERKQAEEDGEMPDGTKLYFYVTKARDGNGGDFELPFKGECQRIGSYASKKRKEPRQTFNPADGYRSFDEAMREFENEKTPF